MKNEQLETMLTARQVADFLQVSISTVRRWSDGETLKYYRIGSRGDRRYRREDVLLFLQKSSSTARNTGVEKGLSSQINTRNAPASRLKTKHGERKPVGTK
jgi:excisionase family DNA binding protein